ncbi:MAG: hypothetical protein LBE89_05555 [Helicobacteraceae bacterium]|jgi:hypothetical protein|nr:hypothetical protein [Helicobacteraceae bacterium]
MRRLIAEHIDLMEKRLNKRMSKEELERIARFHLAQTAAFCHERLIHLLVTLFFGATLPIFVFAAILLKEPLLFLIACINLIVELFYIKHYFFLENNVQKLYQITQKLFGQPFDQTDENLL